MIRHYFTLIAAVLLNGIAFSLLVALMLLSVYLSAYGATLFEWDRNMETDVDHYEMYACNTSSTCVPGLAPTDQIGSNIPQPASGMKPTMPIPVGKEGRAAVLAVDLSGNKSGLSNIVPFDLKSPASPGGLVTK